MIIPALALLAATILSMELMRAVSLLRRFGRLARLGGQAGRMVVRTGVSEWAKERAMRLLAARLFACSAHNAAMLTLTVSPLLLLVMMDRLCPFGVAAALIDWRTRLLLLAATLPLLLRRRAPAHATAAPRGDRLFQRLALGNPAIGAMSFDIERAVFSHAAGGLAEAPPVFITGLARAGTTILLRLLHESGDFASLTYRDLPFPLAPNLWHRIGLGRHWQRTIPATERGHGDGLLYDLDSPEAIEERFWLTREGRTYRFSHGLVPIPPVPDTIASFRDYVGLVRLRHGGHRYLSKNNNNILRLPALIAACPGALLVHPFRGPLQHAASLRRQHLRACALATDDPYRRDFMGWLGHHEFGADQRPFLLPGAPEPDEDRGGIDYWLKLWISVHRHLLCQPAEVRERQLFLDYDALHSGAMDGADLADMLAVATPIALDRLRSPATHAVAGASDMLLSQAMAVHRMLVARAGPVARFHVARA